jgi:hypothetical protein
VSAVFLVSLLWLQGDLGVPAAALIAAGITVVCAAFIGVAFLERGLPPSDSPRVQAPNNHYVDPNERPLEDARQRERWAAEQRLESSDQTVIHTSFGDEVRK